MQVKDSQPLDERLGDGVFGFVNFFLLSCEFMKFVKLKRNELKTGSGGFFKQRLSKPPLRLNKALRASFKCGAHAGIAVEETSMCSKR